MVALRSCRLSPRHAVLVLTACFSMLLTLSSADAAEISAPPGKALIYVIQKETGPFGNILIYMDGRLIDRMAANTHVAIAVDPGTHEISSAGTGRATYMLAVEADRVHYVSLKVGPEGFPEIRDLPEADGRSALARTRPVQSGYVVTKGTLVRMASSSQSDEAANKTAGVSAMIIKTGSFKLSDSDQTFGGLPAVYEENSSGEFAFEFEKRSPQGFAFGVELFNYKNTFLVPPGLTGEAGTILVTANIKKYFEMTGMVRPFVGIGLGSALTQLSKDATGSGVGFAYQFLAGVELRFGKVGVYAEYKNVHAEPEDSDGEKINVSGSGAFVGVSIALNP